MGRQPRVSVVEMEADIPALVRALGFGDSRPVLVLIGGAAGMSDAQVADLTDHLSRYVLPVVQRAGAVVLDGGTDSGVMRAIGRARSAVAGGFPLVGVVARGAMSFDRAAATADAPVTLEPNHTDLLVIPGEAWGDEVPWLAGVAAAVSGLRPSATLLVNGGEIAYRDLSESLRHSRPVVVLSGSGRTADDVGAAVDASDAASTAAHQIAQSPLTVVVRYTDGPQLRHVLSVLLGADMITQ